MYVSRNGMFPSVAESFAAPVAGFLEASKKCRFAEVASTAVGNTPLLLVMMPAVSS
jgi:hypothetical protein